MSAPDGFAALILTHGRADRVITHDALRRFGYTGPIYLIVDDQDDQIDRYREQYGDNVNVFDKAASVQNVDTGDQRDAVAAASVVFARNSTDVIAQRLGLRYYMQLDDDYNRFSHRVKIGDELKNIATARLDDVLAAYITFLEQTGALTVAFSQAGDHIAGATSGGFFQRGLSRKAMNSFLVRVGRPIEFLGRINEDTTAYCVHGNRGELFLTPTGFQLNQLETQSNDNGLTTIYQQYGTYVKSMYSVMMSPSFVRIRTMGPARRIHHQVKWLDAVPQIISERYRKTA